MKFAIKSLYPLTSALIVQQTALHVGSLLQIMILRLMQKHGHKPIVLLGVENNLIGDPSGKDLN